MNDGENSTGPDAAAKLLEALNTITREALGDELGASLEFSREMESNLTHRMEELDRQTSAAVDDLKESFFSRLRRMIGGQHHKVGGQHLDAYATHAAWLEDHKTQSNGRLADRLIGNALGSPVSWAWKGYWQRRAA